eukprot:7680688-Prorocentrum_lima.AAC.1
MWLSSLTEQALEGTQREQQIAQRSLWRALEPPAPRPLPSLLAADGLTVLSPEDNRLRWAEHWSVEFGGSVFSGAPPPSPSFPSSWPLSPFAPSVPQ